MSYLDKMDSLKILPHENRGAGPVETRQMTAEDWQKYGTVKGNPEDLKKYRAYNVVKPLKNIQEDNKMGRNALNKENLLKYIKEGCSFQDMVRKFGANEDNVRNAIEAYDFQEIYDIKGFYGAEEKQEEKQEKYVPIVTLEGLPKSRLKVTEVQGQANIYRSEGDKIIIIKQGKTIEIKKDEIMKEIQELQVMCEELKDVSLVM